MKAQGLVFLGVRTAGTDVMAAFFTDVMGLPLAQKAHDFVRFQLPNRDQIELWGPSLETQAHVTTGPMPEFLVHDVEQAQAELKRRGSRFLVRCGSGERGTAPYTSEHQTAPCVAF